MSEQHSGMIEQLKNSLAGEQQCSIAEYSMAINQPTRHGSMTTARIASREACRMTAYQLSLAA
jgi:hypothetical protein